MKLHMTSVRPVKPHIPQPGGGGKDGSKEEAAQICEL